MNLLKRLRQRRLLKSAAAKIDRKMALHEQGALDEALYDPALRVTREEHDAMMSVICANGLLSEAAMSDRLFELKELAESDQPVTREDAEEAVALGKALINRMAGRMGLEEG